MQLNLNETRQPLIHIKPKKGWQLVDIKELKEYRDLFYFLVTRNIKVKYKQTILGGLWAIIQPFFSMVVFTLFFGKLAKIPSDGIPYPIFNYSAMVAWTFFATSITNSGNSLVMERNLISKVYFPRLIIPLSSVLASLLDFIIAFSVLLLMMVYFHIYPTLMTITIPFLITMMVLIASGTGAFLAALNAKYRDIRYVIPFLVQMWMFSSPIVYPTSMIPEKFRFFYALNPMVGIIEGFRSALLGTNEFPWKILLISSIVSLLIFFGGLLYFRQVERYFADII